MDPGNCFQLLDSQASISDQLYCHTMSSYAIHTHVTVPYPCQHSHKEWWSLVTSINYWLLCSTVSNHNLAAVIRKQRNWSGLIGNGRNYISSRQAMIICTLTQEKIEVPALDSPSWWSLPYQQTTRTAAACIGGWGWVRCALFRVCCSSVQFWLFDAIELAFKVNSSWREVRRQLPPLQLCPSWRFEVSGCGFPARSTTSTVHGTVEK